MAKLHFLKSVTDTINTSFILESGKDLLMVDGGFPSEAPYLYEYLKSLGGHVQAWFITHLHRDHCGLLGDFLNGTSDAEALTVDGFYFNTPAEDVFELDTGALEDEKNVREAAKLLKTSDGGYPLVFSENKIRCI